VIDGAYRDSKAFSDHYEKVAPILKQLLGGVASIDKLEIHACKQELEKTREITKHGIFNDVAVQEFSTDSESWNEKK
jgi:hypothetical protein